MCASELVRPRRRNQAPPGRTRRFEIEMRACVRARKCGWNGTGRIRIGGKLNRRGWVAARGKGADKETMDELIHVLLSSKAEEEKAKVVADNVLSFDQSFWLRIAEKADQAGSQEEKEELSELANSVMKMVDNLVRATETQMEDSSTVLQEILSASADPDTGEWQVPLNAREVESMRQAIEQRADKVDEAVIANAYAWMRKASMDKLPGMVEVIQTALQLYAGLALSDQSRDDPLDKIIAAAPADWETLLREEVEAGRLSEDAFQEGLQKRMEGVVIGLESGSYRQRVQAEYLKELETRAKAVF